MSSYESLGTNGDRIDCSHVEIFILNKDFLKEKVKTNPYDLPLAHRDYLADEAGCVDSASLYIELDQITAQRVVTGTISLVSKRLRRRGRHLTEDIAELLNKYYQPNDITLTDYQRIYVDLGSEGSALIDVSDEESDRYSIESSLALTQNCNVDEDYEIIRRQAELWGNLQNSLASIDGSPAQMKSITIGAEFLKFPPRAEERVYLGIVASNTFFNELESPRLGTVDFTNLDITALLEHCPNVSYEEAYKATSLAIHSLRAKPGQTPPAIGQIDIIKEVERLRFAPRD